jgi:hypothetical protein
MQFVNSIGAPDANGTLEFRDPATDLLKDTYPTRDAAEAQTNANTNPVQLDSRGEAAIFLRDGEAYKVLMYSSGVLQWTIDNVETPIGNTTAAAISIADTGGYYAATDVEAALQELGGTGGAGIIGVQDAGGYFAGSDAEAVLQEVGLELLRAGGFKGRNSTASKTSDDTLADDSILYNWTIEGSKVYAVNGVLRYFQNAGDFKFRFTTSLGLVSSFIQYSWEDETGNTGSDIKTSITTTNTIDTAADGENVVLLINAGFVVDTVADTMDFQWAQANVSANSTNLVAGSWIEIVKAPSS